MASLRPQIRIKARRLRARQPDPAMMKMMESVEVHWDLIDNVLARVECLEGNHETQSNKVDLLELMIFPMSYLAGDDDLPV